MGEVESFRELLSKEEMLIILERTLRTNDFDLGKFSLTAASEHPMGFLGVHAKFRVSVTTKDGVKELSYFVKKIPTAVPQHLDYTLKTRAFYKEIELYKTLFVDLKKAQSAEVPTKWCPEYYYSRGEELIVTEDLSAGGYYMLPERTLMDEEHIRAALAAMAAMHAASFTFEEKFNRNLVDTVSPYRERPEGRVTLGDIYSHLTFETEASDKEGHPGNTYYEAGIRSQVNIIDLLPDLSSELREKTKTQLPDILRKMLQLVKPSNRYRNVFIHGDLWANNLLFRREGDNVSALLIDFQLARYGPPAHDVVLFLHLVQTRDFRRERQNDLLDYYHQKFSEEIEKNGITVEETLPKVVFLKSCRDYYELGLLSSILYFQLILTPSSITSKFLSSTDLYMKNMFMDRTEMILECFRKDDIFKSRMTEVMKDLVERFVSGGDQQVAAS